MRPQLGLVCLTSGPEVRFRTVTLSRYRALSPAEREAKLLDLYASNIAVLHRAAAFCAAAGIRLYRLSSALFPMLDLEGDSLGAQVLDRLAPQLLAAGHALQDAGLRVLMHPEQFIVLNSDRPEVRASSLRALQAHARVLDGHGLSAHRLAACGYSLGARFTPSWMDTPMFYEANPWPIEPGMVLFLHMILMDSGTGTAMCLGRTSLVGGAGAEPLNGADLNLMVR